MISKSNHPQSGFYLNNISDLKNTLTKLDAEGKKVLLIGVSFALLDLVEAYKFELKKSLSYRFHSDEYIFKLSSFHSFSLRNI